ncbi:MAG: replicative DNA helicase [Candidatus Bipolaricaulota bacterium]|nr:replicative DNA helicase [Candidatus Bipolaricaulota bacterium]
MAREKMGQAGETYLRNLPKNLEAEQVVLGSTILEPEGMVPVLMEKLRPEHFYRRAHRIIFRAIRELFERGEPADIVAVANRLLERGDMEQAGGRIYLNELLDRVTTTASLEYYADIIRRKALLRALIDAGGRITELGYDEARETDETLDKAESILFDISRHESTGEYYLLSQFLYEHIDALEELHRDPERHTITGLGTGFPKVDEMTSGLQRSDLIVLAGRPGTGKTSLALSIARHTAIREQATVGIFSLEMAKEQLLERLLCGEAKVSLHRLRGGYVPAGKWRDLANAASKFQRAHIIVDDTPGASILEIKAKARRMAAQHGLDMLIVDYLQLVEGGIRTDVREQEISYISRSLKHLARELDAPVIAVSQLNRAVERRESKVPQLADLRESGAIEQDADIVAFIYRKDYYDQPMAEPSASGKGLVSEAEVIIAKQRNGPLGRIKVAFHKAYASFYPTAREDGPPF